MTLASTLFDVVLPAAIAALAAAWLVRRAVRSLSGKSGCACPSAQTGKGCVKADEMSKAVQSAVRKTAAPR